MNMQKLHDFAQSQMFELRAQSGRIIVLDTTTLLTFHFLAVLLPSCGTSCSQYNKTSFFKIIFMEIFSKISEEERAARQAEVNLLMDEVERAQTRLQSLEREKVIIH